KEYKHKFDFGRDKPLTAQVNAVVYPETKAKLQKLAEQKQCSVPDLIRAAIDKYIEEENIESIEIGIDRVS
ncbi:MAG: ribbon-helix-helix protein, CopG family, partial [Prochloraceae cyanobacterium]